jgi:hypothetical protein
VNPKSVADGLLTSMGSITWPIVKANVGKSYTQTDTYERDWKYWKYRIGIEQRKERIERMKWTHEDISSCRTSYHGE